MSIAAFWAWAMANEAALATVLFILSEFLGAFPGVKSNGFASFVIIHIQKILKDKGANDPTP
jgi:hypothetical protein